MGQVFEDGARLFGPMGDESFDALEVVGLRVADAVREELLDEAADYLEFATMRVILDHLPPRAPRRRRGVGVAIPHVAGFAAETAGGGAGTVPRKRSLSRRRLSRRRGKGGRVAAPADFAEPSAGFAASPSPRASLAPTFAPTSDEERAPTARAEPSTPSFELPPSAPLARDSWADAAPSPCVDPAPAAFPWFAPQSSPAALEVDIGEALRHSTYQWWREPAYDEHGNLVVPPPPPWRPPPEVKASMATARTRAPTAPPLRRRIQAPEAANDAAADALPLAGAAALRTSHAGSAAARVSSATQRQTPGEVARAFGDAGRASLRKHFLRCTVYPGSCVYFALGFTAVEGVPMLAGREIDGHISLAKLAAPEEVPNWERMRNAMDFALTNYASKRFKPNGIDHLEGAFSVSAYTAPDYGIADIRESPLLRLCKTITQLGRNQLTLADKQPWVRTMFHVSIRAPWIQSDDGWQRGRADVPVAGSAALESAGSAASG